MIVIFVIVAIAGSFISSTSATIGEPVVIAAPQQVHISYGQHNDQIWVTWLTFENSTAYKLKPTVQYGFDQAKLESVVHGHATHFMNGNRTAFVHRVLLSKLKHDTVYCKFLFKCCFQTFMINCINY